MEIVRLTETNLEQAAKKAADVLKKGGIVIYPTDTVYGIGVSAFDPEAIARLRKLKAREQKRPISVIVPDVDSIEKFATLTPLAEQFAKAHLPGALTLVVPAHPSVPDSLTLNGSIGVRIPNEPFCLALAKAFGKPFTTTSANKAGMGTPRTAQEIMNHFSMDLNHIALVIDGGERNSPNPSTVISCVGEVPYVLREGALSKEALGLK